MIELMRKNKLLVRVVEVYETQIKEFNRHKK